MQLITTIFAVIGGCSILYFILGFSLDAMSLDQTRGGYEPPYEGWSGQPVDWDAMDRTRTGLVKRGHVLNVHIHGTTGMMSFEVLGMRMDWQTPSDRALAVHKPREGLLRRGFQPEF